MKLVILMYLEEDAGCARKLLHASGISMFSQMPMEGIGEGTGSWYGGVVPYASHMAFCVVSSDQAAAVLSAVKSEDQCLDARHPMRAVQLAVEATTASGTESERTD